MSVKTEACLALHTIVRACMAKDQTRCGVRQKSRVLVSDVLSSCPAMRIGCCTGTAFSVIAQSPFALVAGTDRCPENIRGNMKGQLSFARSEATNPSQPPGSG